MKEDKYRDPIHGFINVNEYEQRIINSMPFQRLRNIKQLGLTNLVYYGADHTRFAHSIGVMHLVGIVFDSVIKKEHIIYSEEKKKWLRQIVRLIALTHDLGHAPFSHAAESVFPNGLEHEDYTRKIILETNIADIINELGESFINKYGEKFNITPQLICDIYSGVTAGQNNEFVFLKTLMDSELDCDKMDYLLRDSLYCGVEYGKFDINRLISCLTIFIDSYGTAKLAIESGGIQAFESFVLARYFMFIQVYFHKTRRFFDIMYSEALKKILPDGVFPENTYEYLEYDDNKIFNLIKDNQDNYEECYNIINRIVYPSVFSTKTHPKSGDENEFNIMKKSLFNEFGANTFLIDSANKMPHKIPVKSEIDHEKSVVIIKDCPHRVTTIYDESIIISNLSEMIKIETIYSKPEKFNEAKDFVGKFYEN